MQHTIRERIRWCAVSPVSLKKSRYDRVLCRDSESGAVASCDNFRLVGSSVGREEEKRRRSKFGSVTTLVLPVLKLE